MPPSKIPARVKASAVHLGLSALVAAIVSALFVAWWFPLPYFVTDGGYTALRLVVAVDVVVGPLLTLVAFNTKKPKKELVRDLAIIGLMQLAALGSGLWLVSTKRVVANIYADGYFYPLDADTAYGLGDKVAGLIKESKQTPALLAVDLPDEIEARQEARRFSMKTGQPLYAQDRTMVPFGQLPQSEIEATYESPKLHVKDSLKLEGMIKGLPKPAESYYFIPTVGRYEGYFLLVDRKTLAVETYLRGLAVQ